ncbi:MAG: hypothetical protein O3C21_00955 [Verrucomicrobia bacterium]|nr:hypothetical protein [Verrucomicrobiota bacterium]
MATFDWLRNWDDLVHGTVVFSAAIPFVVCLLIIRKMPADLWWVGIVGAVIGPVLWLFGLPRLPPATSEDFVFLGVVASALVVGSMRVPRLGVPGAGGVGMLLFGLLIWCVYPAWLAEEGGLGRKALVTAAMLATMGLCAVLSEAFGTNQSSSSNGKRIQLPLSALVPPLIGLAVLLQLGGAARLGQAAGAFATTLATASLLIIFRNRKLQPMGIPALWGVMFALLGWSGWLFAELRYGLALALCLAPIAGLLSQCVPLPRRGEARFDHLWSGVFSAVIAGIVVGIAVSDYLAEMQDTEGY